MEPERFAVSRSRNICTYPQAHWEFSKHDLFLKGSRNNFPSWFSRCNFDFYPITSYHFNTLYKRILEVGVATTSFRFRKSKSGDQLNECKRRYLTIVELPPFPFSSRVGLRQVFCASRYVYHKNAYSCGLNLFAVSLHFVGAAGYQLSIPTVQKVPGR